ncbi:MAG TPA: ABC-2 family transporter protein [Dehalococcoidia bacterium]|nr:ABC-2 family transporter protein [Dehalococcoidia bacterium]
MLRQLRFVRAYVALNFAAAMEYRAAFLSQVLGMMANNAIVAVFWWIFFLRFPNVAGWRLSDELLIWAVVATSFGLANGIFGNCARIATLIMQGQLDYYLALPKDALLHALVSRMGPSAWGDAAFGVLVFLLAGQPSPGRVLLFALFSATGCTIFVAYGVLTGSLAFWTGGAEAAAQQAGNALTNFALYPGGVFRDWVRLLTFTLIPAGALSHLPVALLRRPQPAEIAGVVAFAAGSLALAVAVFQLGLRRYQSGNLVDLRG